MAESFVLPGFDTATKNCMLYQNAKSIIHIEGTLDQNMNASNPLIVNIQPFTYGILHLNIIGGDPDGAPIACAPFETNQWGRIPVYYTSSGSVTSSYTYFQILNNQIKLYTSNSAERGFVSGFLYIIE